MFHIPHGSSHMLIPMHTDRITPWTVKQSGFISWWDHWTLVSLDSAIGTGFCKLLSVFAISTYQPHMLKWHMQTFGNRRNHSKTAPISLYFVRFPQWDSPASFTPSLFHILVSFLHVGHISMLTNRPCHRPWTVNEFRRFRSLSSPVSKPSVVSGESGTTYR